MYAFSSPKLNKPAKRLGVAKETAMIPCHFPQPYFDTNPYVDPKKDPPTRRLYIPPKEIALPAFLAGRPCFIPTGPGKLVKNALPHKYFSILMIFILSNSWVVAKLEDSINFLSIKEDDSSLNPHN